MLARLQGPLYSYVFFLHLLCWRYVGFKADCAVHVVSQEGTVSGMTMVLESTSMARSSTARKPYATQFGRVFEVRTHTLTLLTIRALGSWPGLWSHGLRYSLLQPCMGYVAGRRHWHLHAQALVYAMLASSLMLYLRACRGIG